MVGGVEVALLGVRFSKDWKFGSVSKKLRPQRIGVTIVLCACCLFHQSVACTIVVSFKHQGVVETQDLAIGRQPTTFKFIDDDEVVMLIRTALSVLGCKMSGRMVNAIFLAHRILKGGA